MSSEATRKTDPLQGQPALARISHPGNRRRSACLGAAGKNAFLHRHPGEHHQRAGVVIARRFQIRHGRASRQHTRGGSPQRCHGDDAAIG